MLVQERHKQVLAGGPCSDCGAMVDRRMECIDGVTHSTVELCAGCWSAYQQRQVFSGGCCG
jgi:hypothetical protein